MSKFTSETLRKKLLKFNDKLEEVFDNEIGKGDKNNCNKELNNSNEDSQSVDNHDTSSSNVSKTKDTGNVSNNSDCEDEDDVYIVDYIIDVRISNTGFCEYLVKWKGYGNSYNTWEPTESFIDKKIIDDFWATRRAAALEMLENNVLPTDTDFFDL